MMLKCCLLHIDIVVPRHVIFCVSMSISPSYLCYQFGITIFIFITSSHIISFKQTHLFFFGHFCQNFSLRVLLSFCLILFANLSLTLLIKVLLLKKRVLEKQSLAKIVFLKISQSSHENTCLVVSFWIKLQAWDLQL